MLPQPSLLKAYDDEEVARAFDRCKEAGVLVPAKLEEALRELGVSPVQHAEGVMTLDDFKRVARQPSEAEQWIQMIPLAGLLARAFRKRDLDGLENLQPDEVASGFEAFSSAATTMVETRLRKLKDQKQKLRDLPSDDSKFGGQLEGGNVEDFHRGLADRLGNSSFDSYAVPALF